MQSWLQTLLNLGRSTGQSAPIDIQKSNRSRNDAKSIALFNLECRHAPLHSVEVIQTNSLDTGMS
jgi:hypothetical protein